MTKAEHSDTRPRNKYKLRCPRIAPDRICARSLPCALLQSGHGPVHISAENLSQGLRAVRPISTTSRTERQKRPYASGAHRPVCGARSRRDVSFLRASSKKHCGAARAKTQNGPEQRCFAATVGATRSPLLPAPRAERTCLQHRRGIKIAKGEVTHFNHSVSLQSYHRLKANSGSRMNEVASPAAIPLSRSCG